MFKSKKLLFATMFFLFLSCKHDPTSYAIRDFRDSLQPHLIAIVAKGVVMYYDSALRNMATDKELIQLAQSEHPLLRASAFREILKRKSFNHFDALMSHLDDTALVAVDEGEFGIWRKRVSDDILEQAGWKNEEAKNKTIQQVITRHNYLRSAYVILLQIEPQDKYYSFIKDMATRPRKLDDDGHELAFNEIEFALYGLAKFKNINDVTIIKESLIKNVFQLSDVSFKLMKEFADTAYMDVLQTYHRRRFYKFSGNRRDGFSGYNADNADPEDFIEALVAQQNERSALLLDTLLYRLPLQVRMPDKENIRNEVIRSIWAHPCKAYSKLLKKIKPEAEEMLKCCRGGMPVDPSSEVVDTTKENVRW